MDGGGRRKSESSWLLANPYGSSVDSSVNSASAGTPMPTRMSPFERSMEYATRRDSTELTSAYGEFEPSFVRKIGSMPRVASKRWRTSAGVIVQPLSGR